MKNETGFHNTVIRNFKNYNLGIFQYPRFNWYWYYMNFYILYVQFSNARQLHTVAIKIINIFLNYLRNFWKDFVDF